MPSKKDQKLMKPMYKAILEYISNINNSGDIIELLKEKEEEVLSLLYSKLPKNKSCNIKDPKAPKKPLSSYMLFCNEERAFIKTEHPDMNFQNIAKELGSRWNNLSEKEKEKYKKMVDKDKERYTKDCQLYIPPSNEELVKKKQKKTDGVKKPITSYMFFSKHERDKLKSEQPEIIGKDVLVEIGSRWRKLSPKEKKIYDDQAELDKERYTKEKDKVQKNLETEDIVIEEEKIQIPENTQTKINKKSKQPPSAFLFFCQEKRSVLKGKDPSIKQSKMNEELRKLWDLLDDGEKISYENKVNNKSK